MTIKMTFVAMKSMLLNVLSLLLASTPLNEITTRVRFTNVANNEVIWKMFSM